MRAMVLNAPGSDLAWMELADPQPGEIRKRVDASSAPEFI